jgi:GntR family transcriptional regulator/MocR family aminotransferase
MREALSHMLATTRGVPATPSTVMVTRGSQQALDVTARALLAPGDLVAVEALGHRGAWTAFRLAGAQLVPVPVDGEGLSVAALAALVERQPIRAVYVTPHHQFPTTTVMSQTRRAELLSLAARHRLVILEDDYDHEFHYDGRPLLPLAASDRAGSVIYMGTLSKILAPGLRSGFVVAPEPTIERIVSFRVASDIQGDHVTECAIAELFEDGELARHVRRMRCTYMARRDALVAALKRVLGEAVRFQLPAGGMALWAGVAPEIDVERWAERSLARGVAFYGARMYDFEGRYQPFARLGFTFLDEDELREAARRMATALAELPRAAHARADGSAASRL